jgi:DNA-binding Lrp family transcriptional regulator
MVRGYHADIDIARLTSSLMFIAQITLLVNGSTVHRIKQFEKALLKIPKIISSQSVLGDVDYVITIVAASIEDYQAVLAELRTQGGGEFEFVTYPVSKTIKAPAQCDLRAIVSRLAQSDSDSAADRALRTTDESDDNS